MPGPGTDREAAGLPRAAEAPQSAVPLAAAGAQDAVQAAPAVQGRKPLPPAPDEVVAVVLSEVGVWACDVHGRLQHANDALYRQLGCADLDPRASDPGVLVRKMRRLTQREDWGRLQDRLRRRLASGEAFRHELPLRRGSTRPRWLALRGQVLRGPDGQVLGMAGVQIDITEHKQAEALQHEAQRLEQLSRDKSLFLARMSHELRTPMNAVLGFTRLLEDDPLEPPTPRQRDRLGRIAQAADRLLALIDNLLDLAQLEVDSPPPSVRALSVSEWLREAAAAVAGEAERAGVRLVLPHRVQGQVLGDRRRLVQALGHVLLQVVQRCAVGTEIVLEAAVEAAARAARATAGAAAGESASAADHGPQTVARDPQAQPGTVVVRILDPALPVPGQASLFDSAERERAQAFDAEPYPPPGAAADTLELRLDLGLSLALRLVSAVGGRIETRPSAPALGSLPSGACLTSTPGTRPVARVHELRVPGQALASGAAAGMGDTGKAGEPGEPRQPEGSGEGGPISGQGTRADAPALHVLCVEDNPVNLLLLCEVLALRPAVRLRTAVDGGSGLALARAERPDLVLLDLQLPDISGLEVLRQLRAEPALAGCTVIALSADAMPEHIAAGLAAGFDDYWTKPIQFDRFLADIDRLARAHAGR